MSKLTPYPKWILDLKIGDQFLDSTLEYIATVTDIHDGTLYWQWHGLYSKFESRGSRKLELLETAWVPITPLLKELL
jgi:hypothetical protein